MLHFLLGILSGIAKRFRIQSLLDFILPDDEEG